MSRDESYLLDILNEARLLQSFMGDMDREAFDQDILRQRAVVRSIEIMGEAARRLSSEFQAAHTHIPWHEIVGMRNRLIHEYDAIDFDLVWQVIQDDIPKLIAQIAALVPAEDELGQDNEN